MEDSPLKFLVQNFGGTYGGSGVSSTLQRSVTPDATKAPTVAQPSLFDKIGSVIGQTAHIGASVAGAAGKFVENSAVDIGKAAYGTGKTLVDLAVQPLQLANANRNIDTLNSRQSALNASYQAGEISLQDYNSRMKDINGARSNINDKLLNPITNGRTAAQRSQDVLETAVNVLTLGSWSLAEQGVKTAAKEVIKGGFDGTILKAVGKIEDTLLRIPAAKELITRNAESLAKQQTQRLAGETMEQYMAREGKRVAVGLLIKRPLFYQQNIQDAKDVYNNMAKGHYGAALQSTGWIASQMLGGGPLGWFLKEGKNLGIKLRDLSRGRGSFIDTLSSQIGDNNPAQIARYLNKIKEKAPNEFQKSEELYRIMQETNLRVSNEHVNDAVQNVLHTYDQAGVDRTLINPKTFVDDYGKWHEAAQITDSLKGRKIDGLTPEQVNNLVVVRWDSVMKRGLASAMEDAGNDKQAMVNVLNDYSSRTSNGWGNNPNLMKQLTRAVDESASAKEVADRIKSIPTATVMPDNLPKSAQKRLAALGYGVAVPLSGVRNTPIIKLEDTRKIVSGAIKGATDIFDEATEPSPIMSAIAGGLDKAGLSPQGTNQIANDSLRQSLAASLEGTSVGEVMGLAGGDTSKGGAAVLSQLQRYVENRKAAPLFGKISSGKSAITDIRMLRVNEISEALGVSASDAKEVQKAILDAYTKVPLEIRGLGDRMVDYAFKYNPAQKHYARIQSALRYTYNPFFRIQEQVETAALAKMNANKFLWMQSKETLDQGVEKLTQAGFFEGNLMSAAADDVVFGRISANMTKFQKRNLTGLAQTIADRKGMSIDDMIKQYPEELDDALRVVVQYPNKGVLASSMARTINLAFFPMRYNAKLSLMAANKIAELPPSLQLGVIQGFLKTKDWLKSDEGIRWQSENSDAIQVFKWITPIGSIQSFYKLVTGNIESPADLGLLGGLPFGIISQMLDSQGVISLNTPYVDQSGKQFPSYIPQSTKARAATALNDLLGTMFSFPGRTLGLPGKGETLRKVVDAFVHTNGTDFDKQLNVQALTPLEKNWIRVLKGDTSDEAVNSLYTSPADGQFNYYTIPPLSLPVQQVPGQVPVLSRTQVASMKPQTRAKRIASPIVRPGQ